MTRTRGFKERRRQREQAHVERRANVPTSCAACDRPISRVDDYEGNMHARCARKVRAFFAEAG